MTRDFLLDEKPDGIINIVDATNIERNLYLSMQLIELSIPMVIALNMMDEMRANGSTVDLDKLEKELGVPVVPISAAKNEGISELIEHALLTAEKKLRRSVLVLQRRGASIAIHAIAHLVEDHAEAIGMPVRFAATKLVKGDAPIQKKLQLSENEIELLAHSIQEINRAWHRPRSGHGRYALCFY